MKNEVMVFEKGVIDKRHFELTLTGLIIRGSPSFEVWENLGIALRQIDSSVQWWLGDWLNYGERQYGEKYSQVLDETDYTYGTLKQFSYVARNVKRSIRIDNLSFSHHQKVANMKTEQQKYWLKLAITEGWSVHRLGKEIKGEEEKEKAELYCFVSDKLECLARHYYEAFSFESNRKPGEDEYSWDPDWSRLCVGNCLCLGFCRDMVRDAIANKMFKGMTVSINKKRKAEQKKSSLGSKVLHM